MSDTTALDRFLEDAGPRALVMARIATSDPDEAMDIVQDAMYNLVERYADRPEAEWSPLFFRILQSRIRDWYRRRKVRNRWRTWLGGAGDEADPIQELPDRRGDTPETHLTQSEQGRAIQAALATLPLRQQQVFMLRAWEGLDVAQTAAAMGCGEGSVKTHYFRALRALRKRLGEVWP